MVAAVESMAYTGAPPWHGLGVKFEGIASPETILKHAGLDWTVSKRRLFARQMAPNLDHPSPTDGTLPIDNYYGLVRDKDNHVLGICGQQYEPIQNEEAFTFFDAFCEAGSIRMETAGSLHGGKWVWALAKLNKSFEVANDQTDGYILLSHPHIWGKSLIISLTPIRVVCWNTLSYALRTGKKGQKVTIQHRSKFNKDMYQKAYELVDQATQKFHVFENQVRLLSSVHISEEMAAKFFVDVINRPYYKDKLNMQDPMMDPKLLSGMESKMFHYMHAAPGQDLPSARNTLWGAVNAVTFFFDHVYQKNQSNRLEYAWYGDGAWYKKHAMDLAMDRAKELRAA